MNAPKVSIIVPTYCSGDRLFNVVRSLDAQSLPAEEFEVLYIDDGSPDNTIDQLHEIASTRSNVRVFALAHTGWPSAARNFGIENARGEYVLFMDHDDELYRDSLKHGYAFASQYSADVLNGKEARTDQPKWALETYTADFPNALNRDDEHPLVPTNPHKLYRRALLIENRIRFPEGSRVLWEDVFFNLEVAEHAAVISTMSSKPFYHWVQHGNNTSSSFTDDVRSYWDGLATIFEATVKHLSRPSLDKQRQLMLAYQYRTRLIPAVGPDLWERDQDDISYALEIAARLIHEYLPESFDAQLSAYGKARARLIRRQDFSLLKELVHVDAGMHGLTTSYDAAWHNGELEIHAITTWRTSDKRGLALILTDDGRVVRNLSAELARAIGTDLVDVTDEVINARTTLGIKSRSSKITWLIPTTHRVEILGKLGEAAEVTIRSTGTLNTHEAAFGKPLPVGVWDFNAKNELFGVVNHRALRSKKIIAPAVIHRRALEAYVNKNGMLSLDMDQRIRSVARPNKKRRTTARWVGWKKLELRIPLKKLTMSMTRLNCFLQIGNSAPVAAAIENRGRGAFLYGTITPSRGTLPLLVGSSPKRMHNTGYELVIQKFGKVELHKAKSS